MFPTIILFHYVQFPCKLFNALPGYNVRTDELFGLHLLIESLLGTELKSLYNTNINLG